MLGQRFITERYFLTCQSDFFCGDGEMTDELLDLDQWMSGIVPMG